MSALCSIGPRQTTASSSLMKKPIDMTLMPCASSGRILRSPLTCGRSAAEAEHARDRVAPDVGVEHADLLALGAQRGGEVDGQRGLAHAALAGADADDVGDLGQRALGQPAGAAELLLQAGLLLVGEDVEGDVDVRDAVDAARGGRDGGLEVAADRAAGGRQRHGHVDDPAVGDLDRPDHAQLDDVLPQLGVDDDPQGLEDLLSRGHGLHCGRRRVSLKNHRRAPKGTATVEGGEVLRPPAGYEAGEPRRRDMRPAGVPGAPLLRGGRGKVLRATR